MATFNFGDWARARALPELGISEMFGGNKRSLNLSNAQKDLKNVAYPTTGQTSGASSTQGSVGNYNYTVGSNSSANKYSSMVDQNHKSNKDLISNEGAENEKRMREALSKARKMYDPVFSDLSAREAQLPQTQSELLGVVDMGQQTQEGIINRGKEQGLGTLGVAEGDARQEGKKSIRDISGNISSAVSAFGQKLGSMGAGDSSAANMANYAFTKMGNRLVSGAQENTRSQLAQINLKRQEVVSEAENNLAELGNWANEQKVQIGQYISQLRQAINSARTDAKMAMSAEEVEMVKSNYQMAMQRLQEVNNIYMQNKSAIQEAVMQHEMQMEAYSQALQQQAQYQVDPYTNTQAEPGTIGETGAVTGAPIGYADDTEKRTLDELLYRA